jgi:hypothetical protein
LSKVYEPIALVLLFFGWFVALKPVFPWQAVAVSVLAELHFFQRLQRCGKRRELAALFFIGLQALFLIWFLFPEAARTRAIATLESSTGYPYIPWLLLSLSSLAYLLVFIHCSGYFYQIKQPKLARFGERLGLSFSIPIAAISLFEPALRSLNLFLLTLSFLLVAHRRPPARIRLIYSSHVLALLSFCSTIGWLSTLNWLFPPFDVGNWAMVLLGLMLFEWGISTFQPRLSIFPRPRRGAHRRQFRRQLRALWFQSCWHLGFVLAALSYVLWAQALVELPLSSVSREVAYRWELLWLLVPLTLTGVAQFGDRDRRISAAWWSTVALFLAQGLTLGHPGMRLLSLGLATVLMGVNVRYLRSCWAVNLHLGLAIAFGAAWGWDRLLLPGQFLFVAIAIPLLWLLRAILSNRAGVFARLYANAVELWAIALSLGELILLSAIAFGSYTGLAIPNEQYAAAAMITGVALVGRYAQQPNNRAIWGVIWAWELSLAQIVVLGGGDSLRLAIANSVAALLGLGVTAGLRRRPTWAQLSSIQVLPVVYALLGILLRGQHFTAYTGFISLSAAFVGLGVSRRHRDWKGIGYIAIALLSLGGYELLLYPLLQAPAGSSADGLTVLAGLGVAIALAYRFVVLMSQRIHRSRWLGLSLAELSRMAHFHWALASLLMALAIAFSLSAPLPRLTPLGLLWCAILATYAVFQGRTHHNFSAPIWIYVGCLESGAMGVYARLHWPQLGILDEWRGMMAIAMATALYFIPWQGLGWPERPWKKVSFSLPAIALFPWMGGLSSLNLLAVALFYAALAYGEKNVRWSYATLVLGHWVMARELQRFSLHDPLYYALPIGLSLLYIAQLDPHFQTRHPRTMRHHLRLLGLGIICVVALLFHVRSNLGIIPGAIGVFAIAAGLGLRIRAFLYTGTITFLLATSYQLIVLIGTYSFSKWIVCFVAGIALIYFAANFERRREQIIAIARGWVTQLQGWE